MTVTLVAMRREDGLIDSEVHLPGLILRPGQDGNVLVPSEHTVALLTAGYFWSALLPNTSTRTPAQTTL